MTPSCGTVRAFLLARWALVAGMAIGCASPDAAEEASRDSGSNVLDAALPPEERSVKLTLWPFWEIPWLSPGFGVPIPLGGVLVCVSRQRPHGGSWDNFVPTEGRCATTVEGEDLVLDGVPGLSELVITATKEGFQPAAFAVTTGASDVSVHDGFASLDRFEFSLTRTGGWPGLVEVPLEPLTGSLLFYPAVFAAGAPGQFSQLGYLGGVSVSLVPEGPTPPPRAPYYFLGGRPVASARSTVAGSWPVDDLDQVSGALFVNLPEGEYEVRAEHPHAVCGAAGDGSSLPRYGFARPGGSVSAPVLAGHLSTPIAAECFCLDSRDVRYCAPSGDAGLDAAAP